jgi:hypothetical protein
MSCLSLIRDGGICSVVANPVFVITPDRLEGGADVTFEVFEEDATALKALLDKPEHYVLDSTLLWAQLKVLEPCESTHPGLALLRNRSTLRGLLRLIQEPAQTE